MIDPHKRYNELLEYGIAKILPSCAATHVTVATNMSTANLVGATQVVKPWDPS